jgi:hypothetical protein
MKSALEDKRSDAWVARELARHFGLTHEYYETDRSDEAVEKIFERFLTAGEGRTDHVAGYMDGFAIWKRLYESGCQGILRGDEAFGCRAVQSDRQVYHNMSLTVLADFRNVDAAVLGLDADGQQRPESLERRQTEPRAAWRDRLSTEFEIPTVFAALSDLKLAYVEIIHPLLSRRIVETVRTLPDELRTDKTLFKRIVTRFGPNIKYAKRPAIEVHGDILRSPAVVGAIINRLHDSSGGTSHLDVISRYALDMMGEGKTYKPRDDRAMPAWILSWARRMSGLDKNQSFLMDPYHFAFRAYIITLMNDMLSSDANVLKESRR